MSGFKISQSYIVDLDFNDDYKTKFDRMTFFDKIPLRKRNKEEYEGIYAIYQILAQNFKENGLENNFG